MTRPSIRSRSTRAWAKDHRKYHPPLPYRSTCSRPASDQEISSIAGLRSVARSTSSSRTTYTSTSERSFAMSPRAADPLSTRPTIAGSSRASSSSRAARAASLSTTATVRSDGSCRHRVSAAPDGAHGLRDGDAGGLVLESGLEAERLAARHPQGVHLRHRAGLEQVRAPGAVHDALALVDLGRAVHGGGGLPRVDAHLHLPRAVLRGGDLAALHLRAVEVDQLRPGGGSGIGRAGGDTEPEGEGSGCGRTERGLHAVTVTPRSPRTAAFAAVRLLSRLRSGRRDPDPACCGGTRTSPGAPRLSPGDPRRPPVLRPFGRRGPLGPPG